MNKNILIFNKIQKDVLIIHLKNKLIELYYVMLKLS